MAVFKNQKYKAHSYKVNYLTKEGDPLSGSLLSLHAIVQRSCVGALMSARFCLARLCLDTTLKLKFRIIYRRLYRSALLIEVLTVGALNLEF